jgi:hypothetical protein
MAVRRSTNWKLKMSYFSILQHCDFRLPLLCKWDLCSSGTRRGAGQYLPTFREDLSFPILSVKRCSSLKDFCRVLYVFVFSDCLHCGTLQSGYCACVLLASVESVETLVLWLVPYATGWTYLASIMYYFLYYLYYPSNDAVAELIIQWVQE